MRMLDNAIDVNFSPPAKPETPTCATVARPFWDCLYALKLPYASPEALDFAGNSMEAVCYFAYLASNKLAVELGAYSSFQGSLWSKRNLLRDDSLHCNFGIDLIDTIKLEYRYAEIPCHAPCWA